MGSVKKSQFDLNNASVPEDWSEYIPGLDGTSVPAEDLYEDKLGPPQYNQPPELPSSFSLPPEAESIQDCSDFDCNDLSDTSPEHGAGQALIQVDDEEPQLVSFTLPLFPGADYQDELEDPAELEVEEDQDEIEVNDDPWSWTVETFMNWLPNMLKSVPKHSGKDSVGIERAISFFEGIDREISRAVRADKNGILDVAKVENIRDEIYKAIDRLQDRYEQIRENKHGKKRKKKGSENDGIVKEAQKAPSIGAITITVPLCVATVARICVNSAVSAGKDIEDVFDELSKKFDFTPREEMEVMQLISDMGYYIRRPRGYKRDEKIDFTSPDNFDWMQNFSA